MTQERRAPRRHRHPAIEALAEAIEDHVRSVIRNEGHDVNRTPLERAIGDFADAVLHDGAAICGRDHEAEAETQCLRTNDRGARCTRPKGHEGDHETPIEAFHARRYTTWR